MIGKGTAVVVWIISQTCQNAVNTGLTRIFLAFDAVQCRLCPRLIRGFARFLSRGPPVFYSVFIGLRAGLVTIFGLAGAGKVDDLGHLNLWG